MESLGVNVETVERVLLNDGWHFVVPGSIRVGAYEFINEDGEYMGVSGNGGWGTTIAIYFKDTFGEAYVVPVAHIKAVRVRT